MKKEIPVRDLVKSVYNGDIVLPDFQRSFIWSPEDIRELLVSVLGDYFIGTMLALTTVKDESKFALRLVEGVKEINNEAKIGSILRIILDGQQRTTSLFYALFGPDLNLKNRKNSYKYFLDLNYALNKNWDKAVIAISTKFINKINRRLKEKMVISFTDILDLKNVTNKYKDLDNFSEIYDLIDNFLKRIIHIINLPKETNLEKIVETFERINRTGTPLSVFELLTAKLYLDKINLRDLLEEANEKFDIEEKINKPESILRTISLIRDEEPKRKNILNLQPFNFESDWWKAVKSLGDAFNIVTDIKDGFGVIDINRWLPYSTMLVPLAAILNYMKENKLVSPKNMKKIKSWYWVSIFTNQYDKAVDSRSYSDFHILKEWFKDDIKIPKVIKKLNIKEIDLDVDKQTSAIYRGIINLIVLKGALDFKTGNPPQFDKEKIQDDHIFPKSRFKDNSIFNRTLITSNASKGKKLPSTYFKNRIKDFGETELKGILHTHLIPEIALEFLLKDDISSFKKEREKEIRNTIANRIKLLK